MAQGRGPGPAAARGRQRGGVLRALGLRLGPRAPVGRGRVLAGPEAVWRVAEVDVAAPWGVPRPSLVGVGVFREEGR